MVKGRMATIWIVRSGTKIQRYSGFEPSRGPFGRVAESLEHKRYVESGVEDFIAKFSKSCLKAIPVGKHFTAGEEAERNGTCRQKEEEVC